MKPLPMIQPAAAPPVDDSCATGACAAPSTEASPVGEVDASSALSVLRIDGMDCASCAVTLERVVRATPGVDRAVVNFATARLDVHHGAGVDAAGLAAAVARAGFSVRPAAGALRVSWWRSPRAWRLLVAVPLFMAGLAGDLTDAPGQGAWTALLVIAAAVGGWAVYRSALAGVRSRSLDMNVLMAAATVGAGALGQWPEAASIVLLFSLGNLLQAHAIDRTRASVEALSQLTPEAVQVRRGAAPATVLVDDVVVGDLVLVRPGDRVALDGTVEEGSTTVDESAITGEGAPVEKAAGDVVRSGSLNGAGALDVRVTAPAAGSTLQQVVRMVEQAQATKAPVEELVDSIARVYTPVVVLIAVALAVVPGLVTGDWSTWTYRALALLVIACPCSLVISTPVTVVSGIGAASRRGILVKGGSALAAAGGMRSIALDKTGTLTEGRPHVASTTVVTDLAAGAVLGIAAALERRSGHPLAHALLAAAEGQPVLEATDVVGVAGRGARGLVDGVEYSIGSPRLFAELGIPQPPLVDGVVAELGDRGETPVLLGTAAGVVAVFGLADTVRPEAAGAIAALRAAGIEHITMLTGDSTGAAARVAGQLGVDYRAELLPADKVEAIRELQRSHGVVGMVGDGVNDAPALAEADVSFAMGAAGAGVALDAADVTLLQDDLRKLVAVVELSRRSRRVLAQNVVSSVVIKGAFVVLAPFGLVTLWLAVAADLGTSLAVTGNGLRLFRHRP